MAVEELSTTLAASRLVPLTATLLTVVLFGAGNAFGALVTAFPLARVITGVNPAAAAGPMMVIVLPDVVAL
jgi:hypothetical protein